MAESCLLRYQKISAPVAHLSPLGTWINNVSKALSELADKISCHLIQTHVPQLTNHSSFSRDTQAAIPVPYFRCTFSPKVLKLWCFLLLNVRTIRGWSRSEIRERETLPFIKHMSCKACWSGLPQNKTTHSRDRNLFFVGLSSPVDPFSIPQFRVSRTHGVYKVLIL